MEKAMEEKLKSNYQSTLESIKSSTEKSSHNKSPILVAVSKKRPVEAIQVIYNLGQRIFGENYPQELLTKSKTLPKDIEWHLIGHLQTNKVKKLLDEIPNIVIESVDRIDVVKKISQYADVKNKTKIYLEINISGEDSKTGCPIKDIYTVIDEIVKNGDKLEFVGIMSLGKIGDKKEFEKMVQIKNDICEKYGMDKDKFIASFGTSQDFDEAILAGSDEVRIGHQIFEV
jgi:pyridoxal phosphate enzyme (YggS family)